MEFYYVGVPTNMIREKNFLVPTSKDQRLDKVCMFINNMEDELNFN